MIGCTVCFNELGKKSFRRDKYVDGIGEVVGFKKKDPSILKVLWHGAPKEYTVSIKFIEILIVKH